MTTDWRAETKRCARCGAPFGPAPGEHRAHWLGRRYCSRACAHGRPLPPGAYLTCAQCGVRFRGQDRGQRFCSRACVARWQRQGRARQREQRPDG
jgi:hypothetical protein